MKISNFDIKDDAITNWEQLYYFMPDICFRMLIYVPSRAGRRTYFSLWPINCYIMIKYIFMQNIEQSTYPDLTKTFKPISDEIGYDVFESRLNQDWPGQSNRRFKQEISWHYCK